MPTGLGSNCGPYDLAITGYLDNMRLDACIYGAPTFEQIKVTEDGAYTREMRANESLGTMVILQVVMIALLAANLALGLQRKGKS